MNDRGWGLTKRKVEMGIEKRNRMVTIYVKQKVLHAFYKDIIKAGSPFLCGQTVKFDDSESQAISNRDRLHRGRHPGIRDSNVII
jgi:hypothetical protein